MAAINSFLSACCKASCRCIVSGSAPINENICSAARANGWGSECAARSGCSISWTLSVVPGENVLIIVMSKRFHQIGGILNDSSRS